MLRAEQDGVRTDDAQGVSLRLVLLRRAGVDDDDDGPEFDERVGRGEARGPDARDDDAQARPVGIPGGQAGEPGCLPGVGGRRSGTVRSAHPTTHSA
ncbi:hypothetical protein MN0502_13460 [Arthrobacter sp. MN05-02]|nr:hypothetical protein MN0502_13460 [Arthrobacter sp. MN05-02]